MAFIVVLPLIIRPSLHLVFPSAAVGIVRPCDL